MEIIVKNVKLLEDEILVAECKLVLVTAPDGKNYLNLDGNWLNPYLVSEEEICETGEMYLSSIKREIKPKREGVAQAGDKILAFPEQFPPTVLEAIVKGKIKDGDSVLLQCEEDWRNEPLCESTGKCQETEGFKGTEHEGIDVCEDGCVQGKRIHFVKLTKTNRVLVFIPEPVGESGKLKEFYDWYSEANAASRGDVLNELQRRLGLPVEEYPKEPYRYSEEFVLWYSGMKPEQVHSAYRRYHREVLDKWEKDLKQGVLELKHKPKPGELGL